MRKPALVPRVDNNAMPSLRERSRRHVDTLSEHDDGLRPTAKRPLPTANDRTDLCLAFC